jgi:hypothetical protein
VSRTRPTAEESAEKDSKKTVKKAFAKSGEFRHLFNMNMGDWSGDGHGKTEARAYGCNKPFEKVVAAYKKACKKLDVDIHPDKIFEEYEDHSLTEETYFKIFDAGYDILAGFNEAKERARRERELKHETWEEILEYPQVDHEELGLYVIWFCQQGDPDLVFSDEKVEDLFGYSGIRDNVGYGLFE